MLAKVHKIWVCSQKAEQLNIRLKKTLGTSFFVKQVQASLAIASERARDTRPENVFKSLAEDPGGFVGEIMDISELTKTRFGYPEYRDIPLIIFYEHTDMTQTLSGLRTLVKLRSDIHSRNAWLGLRLSPMVNIISDRALRPEDVKRINGEVGSEIRCDGTELLDLSSELGSRLGVALEFRFRAECGELVAASAAMTRVASQIEDCAENHKHALISGPVGVGKYFISRYIHRYGCFRCPRDDRLEVMDCGRNAHKATTQLSRELWGSESSTQSRVSLAGAGTVLLRRIGRHRSQFLTELLGALQDASYTPVKGTGLRGLDARLLLIWEEGDERENHDADSFASSANVTHIKVPSLKERAQDIGFLASHFDSMKLFEMPDDTGTNVNRVSDEFVRALKEYDWPGNVRELKDMVQAACDNAKGAKHLLPGHLPQVFWERAKNSEPGSEARRNEFKDALQKCGGDFIECSPHLPKSQHWVGKSAGQLYEEVLASPDLRQWYIESFPYTEIARRNP